MSGYNCIELYTISRDVITTSYTKIIKETQTSWIILPDVNDNVYDLSGILVDVLDQRTHNYCRDESKQHEQHKIDLKQ